MLTSAAVFYNSLNNCLKAVWYFSLCPLIFLKPVCRVMAVYCLNISTWRKCNTCLKLLGVWTRIINPTTLQNSSCLVYLHYSVYCHKLSQKYRLKSITILLPHKLAILIIEECRSHPTFCWNILTHWRCTLQNCSLIIGITHKNHFCNVYYIIKHIMESISIFFTFPVIANRMWNLIYMLSSEYHYKKDIYMHVIGM